MKLLGDIHGRLEVLEEELAQLEPDETLMQIGDFGFGFVNVPPQYPPNLLILRGNHDNPELHSKHPNSLDHFGFLPEWGVFYVAGAYSIDKHRRTENVNWWPEEELNWGQTLGCIELYESLGNQVKVVVSHAAPTCFVQKMGFKGTSNTERLLQTLYDIHQPQQWFCGHYHNYYQKQLGSTRFRCVNINEVVTVEPE